MGSLEVLLVVPDKYSALGKRMVRKQLIIFGQLRQIHLVGCL